jgi:hypothetical protein
VTAQDAGRYADLPIAQSVLDACVALDHSCAMGDVEDFHRDFLPRFIDAQRAYHDGDPEPNNALWSTTDPVSCSLPGDCLASGPRMSRRRFGSLPPGSPTYVAASGSSSSPTSAGTWPTRWPSSATQHRARPPSVPDRTPGHPRIPSRGRTVAGGAPPCRPQGGLSSFDCAAALRSPRPLTPNLRSSADTCTDTVFGLM